MHRLDVETYTDKPSTTTFQCNGHNQPARHHAGLASKYDTGQSIDIKEETLLTYRLLNRCLCVEAMA